MSKRGYISRYSLILQKLKNKPYSTYEELRDYIERQVEFLRMQDENLEIGLSKRTLQRDLREIRNIFGIDIEYSRSQKGYFISNKAAENMNFQRRMEAFDIFNSLNLSQELQPFIHLENRRPQGTENLHGLIHAIKNRYKIKFHYQKFGEEDYTQRLGDPCALKEYRNRWYVLVKDQKDGKIKGFALDRLSELEITKERFEYPKNYSVEEAFRYSFGVINPNDKKPEDIILSFTPFQGRYIKTLPLHESQKILEDNDHELRIQLRLCTTYDFMMELLSVGERVKVIAPKSLVNKIKKEHKKAFELYEE